MSESGAGEVAGRVDSSDTDASMRTAEWLSRTASATTGANDAGPHAGGGSTNSSGHPAMGTLQSLAGLWYTSMDSFRDLVQLHKGRHSSVWSAVCKRTGKTLVIKGYQREHLKARQLANVHREISLLKFFKDSGCKGVVVLLTSFEDKANIYLVFEACMRGDLYQLLMKNRGVLHEEFVCTKVVFPLLCVLQQLHKLHVVHRDIKPENIFITEEGDIALGDFGLAAHKFQDRMTERVGTLDYMAPEVLSIPCTSTDEPGVSVADAPMGEAARAYDEKVDIWATGVLVFELLTGKPPFEVEDPKETARLILSGELSKFPVHISQQARDFVHLTLSRNPADRPSADDLLQHGWLKHYFGGKVPEPAHACGSVGGMSVGLMKSWLVASWSTFVRPPSLCLKPNSCAPNRLLVTPSNSPRRALSTGDDPALLQPPPDSELKPSPQYKRKSLPGGSDAGSDGSPRELRKYETLPHASTSPAVVELERQLSGGAAPQAMNRLASSQFPSRDSSAGSMDNVITSERTYQRNESNASGSSTISIASFASLQHVPRSASVVEFQEQDDLGMVQRSVSVCPVSMARPGAGPGAGGAGGSSILGGMVTGNSALKPVWAAPSGGTGTALGKKVPGKSRFAG